MHVDEEKTITNILWADGRAIMDYSFFGDVVCFDITCKTSQYGRPLGIFVGVNHHRKTVVFSVALLYNETIPSFT